MSSSWVPGRTVSRHGESLAQVVCAESQDDKLQGEATAQDLKRLQCCGRLKNHYKNQHKKGPAFTIDILELLQPQQSLALSVLGGEAYCMILAHHRSADRRFLNC